VGGENNLVGPHSLHGLELQDELKIDLSSHVVVYLRPLEAIPVYWAEVGTLLQVCDLDCPH